MCAIAHAIFMLITISSHYYMKTVISDSDGIVITAVNEPSDLRQSLFVLFVESIERAVYLVIVSKSAFSIFTNSSEDISPLAVPATLRFCGISLVSIQG